MKNELIEDIAQERINRLLELAEERALENTSFSLKLSKRYVELARRISMHYKVKISKEKKERICKNCNNFLVPGINCTVRLASSKKFVVYKCECGAEKHIFYKMHSKGL
ncbi:MAG: ribonuclease P protein component 4 [Candidatus Micrarchaeia archaeon]|jgi:ribonuclease P protein subunit RPR2